MLKLIITLRHRFDLWNAPGWFAERLRRDFSGLSVVDLRGYEGIEQQIPDADIAIAWSLRPEQFRLAKKLRWIHSTAAAVHQLMFPELIASHVVLTNAREVHGPVVAEHVMALIFALAKRIPRAVRLQHKHSWGQREMWESRPRPREVAGATLGLIGLGSIGRAVCRSASSLGMKVIAAREHPEKEIPTGIQQVFSSSQIDEVLALSDYVVLCAPVTLSTQGLMNEDRFAKMKPGACLINVSRGPLIDESALIDALRSRRIGGAALDVFAIEPLPAESPLWDFDNLLITPHTAGLTEKIWERQYALYTENLRRFLAGQPLLGLVDKQKGY
jgi:phosphoglycerate dehydrogenase-like enzyme